MLGSLVDLDIGLGSCRSRGLMVEFCMPVFKAPQSVGRISSCAIYPRSHRRTASNDFRRTTAVELPHWFQTIRLRSSNTRKPTPQHRQREASTPFHIARRREECVQEKRKPSKASQIVMVHLWPSSCQLMWRDSETIRPCSRQSVATAADPLQQQHDAVRFELPQ